MVLRARLVDLAGVLVALVCAGAAHAAVTEEHIQQPYPVRALPGETLRKALNAATPITVDGTVLSICPTKIPRRDGVTFVNEGLARFETEGRVGFGISEHWHAVLR